MANLYQGLKKEEYVATTGSFGNIYSAGFVRLTAGSPYQQGIVITMPAADAIISGGMWVAGSKTVTVPAWASCERPLGVCMSTTASGSQPNVLVKGLTYMKATVATTAGDSLMVGDGGALNTVTPVTGSPTSINDVGKCVATSVLDAASGAFALVLIG